MAEDSITTEKILYTGTRKPQTVGKGSKTITLPKFKQLKLLTEALSGYSSDQLKVTVGFNTEGLPFWRYEFTVCVEEEVDDDGEESKSI